MPNYVLNIVDVCGKEEDVERLKKFVQSPEDSDIPQPFDFECIVPPPTMEECRSGGGKGSWAEFWWKWNVEHWGTKWNAVGDGTTVFGYNSLRLFGYSQNNKLETKKWTRVNEESVHDSFEKDELIKDRIAFFTAWSPPGPVLLALSKKFPSIIITNNFEVEGSGFYGRDVFVGGELEDEFYTECPLETDEILSIREAQPDEHKEAV